MNLLVYWPMGCKRWFEYSKVDDHAKQWDGVMEVVEEDKADDKIQDHGYSNVLFALDVEKPQLVRFDVKNNSRLKIALSFTKDSKIQFPSYFQYLFIREAKRMFVVGGSNTQRNKLETWQVQTAKSKPGIYEDLLISTSLTSWEILIDSYKTVLSYNLIYPRYGHTWVDIGGDYIYSIGGKDQNASKVYERWQLDGKSEMLGELE